MELESKLHRALEKEDGDSLQRVYHEIYEQYHGLVAFLINRYVHNPADVEDLVEDVFLSFFSYKNQKEVRSIKSYLASSAKNAALAYLAKAETEPMEEEPASSTGPMSTFLLELEAYLDEEEMNLLFDYYVYDLSAKEIAKEKGVSPESVRMRISRLKKRLSQKFKGRL